MKFLSKEALEKARDNELKKIFLTLRSRIKELEKPNGNRKGEKNALKELQTYYCYVFRELEVRKIVQV